jgi:NMD protein affecting ribosome stability and mRNA decay
MICARCGKEASITAIRNYRMCYACHVKAKKQ